jgi:hypothetical protein
MARADRLSAVVTQDAPASPSYPEPAGSPLSVAGAIIRDMANMLEQAPCAGRRVVAVAR